MLGRWRWTALMFVVACDRGADADALPREWQARADELAARSCDAAATCGCERDTASSPCPSVEADVWRARLIAGHERGLAWDDECALAIGDAIDAAGCAWPGQGAAHPCREFCQVLHGDRELGQSCHGLDALVSDCEKGLLCDRGRCVEPCTRLTGLARGERCRAENGEELDRCADDLTCSYDDGRCTPAVAIGMPCDETRCGTDAFCAWYEEPAVCRPSGTEGVSCELGECASGHSCRYDDASGMARCRADAGVGESCVDRNCADDLWCDGATCRAPGGVGAPCEGSCADDLVCDWTTSLCAPAPAIGTPCDQGICVAGAWCDFADPSFPVCRAALADDEPCSGHPQCQSRFCPAGACRPRPTEGEDCRSTLSCAIGLSCDGVVCRESTTVGPAICVYDGW